MQEGRAFVVVQYPRYLRRAAQDLPLDDRAAMAREHQQRRIVRPPRVLVTLLGHGDVTLANAMGEAAGQTVFHFHVHVIPGLDVNVPRRTPEPGELEEIAAKLR